MKTIFIVISQALLIRNIMRSGALALLQKQGHRIIIFIQCKKIPDYLRQEFNYSNVKLISVPDFPMKGAHHYFVFLTLFLFRTKTIKRYFRYTKRYINKAKLVTLIYSIILQVVSSFAYILKPMTRFIEYHFFPEKNKIIASYFDEYQPDLVFSTSIASKIDVIFGKEARRRKVKSVSMLKSWDTVAMRYYRFVPDYFIAQNEILKEKLVTLQDFPRDYIYVVGFVQFDWYAKKEIIRTREEHFKRLGLDPTLPLIFFGSQGIWYENECNIVDHLYKWVNSNELIKKCQLFIRPHYTNVKETPLAKYKNTQGVVYDNTYHISEYFVDNWDPSVPEMIDFVNSLYHSDIVIIILSTLALDAACLDKPIINTLFGGTFKDGKDVTASMKETDHYQWVMDTKGTSVVYSPEELKQTVNEYLRDPSIKAKERMLLRNKLCYKVDGKSSERLVYALLDILQKN